MPRGSGPRRQEAPSWLSPMREYENADGRAFAKPSSRSSLAAALGLGQRRIVLEAVGLAIDRFLDRAFCGFSLLPLFISGSAGEITLRWRRVGGDNGRRAEKQQNRAR